MRRTPPWRPSWRGPAGLLPALLLGACAPPALDPPLTPAERAAPAPALVALGPLLAAADALAASPEAGPGPTAAPVTGRAAALAARASALRAPVLSPEERDRLLGRVVAAPGASG